MNNINSISKKEKDAKEITVILGKVFGEGYSYIEDSLYERSKIKIPLIYDQGSDYKISLNDDFSQIREKSISESQKYSQSVSSLNNQKNYYEASKISEVQKKINLNEASDAPLLKGISSINVMNSYLTPGCSQWFKYDDIHEMEIKANPEFFSGKYPSKTPEVYKEYRNYIINLFRDNANTYLSSTTCRRHLAGDACSILRIHSFLEHWGLINFNIDPSNKPTNPIIPKSYNYRNPVYVDASSFVIKESTPNFGSKIGDNAIILTSKMGEELRNLYPINNNPENLFRSIFNKNTLNPDNKLNFITKNYRPKCDLCNKLCGFEWHMLKDTKEIKDSLFVCQSCYDNENIPKDLKKDDLELTNLHNIIADPNKKHEQNLKEKFENEKWSLSDTIDLIENLEKYEENWDEIIKHLSKPRTKSDCILHIMQLPLKENIVFKFTDIRLNKDNSSIPNSDKFSLKSDADVSKFYSSVKDCNALSDQSNPIIQQVVFFSKMFENFTNNDLKKTKEELEAEFHTKINSNNTYQDLILNSLNERRDFITLEVLREIVYRTYSQARHKIKTENNEDKRKMKKIMSLIIYLQMRKIEMKLNYFNEFEKIIQGETQQLKSMESQIIQDRIKLALKKSEINELAKKFKDIMNQNNTCKTEEVAINLNEIEVDKILELNEETKAENLMIKQDRAGCSNGIRQGSLNQTHFINQLHNNHGNVNNKQSYNNYHQAKAENDIKNQIAENAENASMNIKYNVNQNLNNRPIECLEKNLKIENQGDNPADVNISLRNVKENIDTEMKIEQNIKSENLITKNYEDNSNEFLNNGNKASYVSNGDYPDYSQNKKYKNFAKTNNNRMENIQVYEQDEEQEQFKGVKNENKNSNLRKDNSSRDSNNDTDNENEENQERNMIRIENKNGEEMEEDLIEIRSDISENENQSERQIEQEEQQESGQEQEQDELEEREEDLEHVEEEDESEENQQGNKNQKIKIDESLSLKHDKENDRDRLCRSLSNNSNNDNGDDEENNMMESSNYEIAEEMEGRLINRKPR